MDVKRTAKSSSDIQKYRAHNSVVNRMTNTVSSTAVTAVEPIKPIKNDPTLISYNSLLASDEFYDKLSKLNKEYRKFYHDQQELEKALKRMSENDECLTENMRRLVEKYNLALESLTKFDMHFGTVHRKDAERVLMRFKRKLSEIGVLITDESILVFDEKIFRDSVEHTTDAVKFLFNPIRGLIINLHRVFKNIKIADEENVYHEYGGQSYNGLFDQKI